MPGMRAMVASQQHHESRLIMPSGRPGNWTNLAAIGCPSSRRDSLVCWTWLIAGFGALTSGFSKRCRSIARIFETCRLLRNSGYPHIDCAHYERVTRERRWLVHCRFPAARAQSVPMGHVRTASMQRGRNGLRWLQISRRREAHQARPWRRCAALAASRPTARERSRSHREWP